ncbi:unnamed protein product [Plutella xylostella]|uniref:Anoctamin n=1 Tax=Plutella xylostella TaxID=51655 RepID=A0A8S4E0B2_PLUXY|nr:unnamed protein product [Plutella xylostella]
MSDGDPSLEDDLPLPLLEQVEENVFTPRITTPIYAGSVKLHHRRSDIIETESLISDAQRNELALQEIFTGDGNGTFHEAEKEAQGRMGDLQAMSVLSTYNDNLSQDMNTDRDNGSEASTRPAEEFTCGDARTLPDVASGNGKPNHCQIVMGGIRNNPSLSFKDGVRSIDFVLVWEALLDDANTPAAIEHRRVFEMNLEKDGLQLEREAPEGLHGLNFVKCLLVLVWEALLDDANTPAATEHRRVFEMNLEKDGLQLEREAPEGLHGLNFVKCTFVLVWEALLDDANTPAATEHRRVFEMNLEKDGLQLEREAPEGLHGLNFVKIHVPLQVLRDYSEILKLRMPMKENMGKSKGGKLNTILSAAMCKLKFSAIKEDDKGSNFIQDFWDGIMQKIRIDPKIFPERKSRLTAIFSKDKEYLFDTTSECFWTPSIRSRIVQFILDRKKFTESEHDDFSFGVARLISNCTYSAAYPLHDGDLKTAGSMRHLLYTEWAEVSKCLKYQPLDYVKDYFGVKIGLYFAWLGFYTHMLIPAAVVGLICFIYSAATIYSNVPSEEVCNYNSTIKMCPLCDYFCEYWDLKDTCIQSRITYLFDNPTTVFFAIFMSFWAACFLELWKRYSAEMTHRWDLTGFDVYEEHPRPQYLARLAHVKRNHMNVVTGQLEPQVPFWRMRVPASLMSFSVVALLVLLALAAVLGVVLYRMSLLGANILRQNDNVLITYNPIMFTSATAAGINLLLICVFNYIYQYLAEWLTERELLRTQTEFDDSLTLKIYLLQFVNYYASIFYIAFFKGKFVGRPGEYVRLFGHRRRRLCSPGGCLLELSIQLAIIMVGKQVINTAVEMTTPRLLKWYNIIRTIGRKNVIHSPLQWVKDFKLVDFGNMGLFPEYLEMVLQYGFVTIFVAARPVPHRVNDIGVWYRILDSIGKLSIITNGFIIAFTSDFIPRLVYQYHNGGSLANYVNHTLADFDTSVLEHPPPRGEEPFPGYWYASTSDDYDRSSWYWHVMAPRLAFVVVFENIDPGRWGSGQHMLTRVCNSGLTSEMQQPTLEPRGPAQSALYDDTACNTWRGI